MKIFSRKVSLKNKISSLFFITTLIVLIILGIYFDSFLKKSFLVSSQKRMQHGFQRLAYNLQEIEADLLNSAVLIDSDVKMLASIALINQYQNKDHYNTYLLDEEKKLLLEGLLNQVKFSLNNNIALYDKNDELIAFVTKQGQSFHLNFFSYHNGQKQLYGKDEKANAYQPEKNNQSLLIDFKHTAFYTVDKIKESSLITYHFRENQLIIKSHHSIFNGNSDRSFVHIELSKHVDADYFENFSKDLGVTISFTNDELLATKPLNLMVDSLSDLNITQTDSDFRSVTQLKTLEGTVYFVSALAKSELSHTLFKNRQQLFIIIAFAAISILILIRLMITRGLAKPLSSLMSQISKIEQYDYSSSPVITTGDELEEISFNINRLAHTVQVRENALQLSKKNLKHLSNHDPLTGLPNRRFFNERLKHALDLAKRENSQLAVVFFDLDHFKQINDRLGHDVGDQLLKEVSREINLCIRNIDTLARISGDEFILLIEKVSHLSEIETIIEKLIVIFNEVFICHKNKVRISASIGISIYPQDGEDSVTLVKHADLAMYKAKDSGRNNYSFFTESLSTHLHERTDKISALTEALENKSEFELLYQPKVSADNEQKITGVEALIRWHSNSLGFVQPDQFIPLAEETGLIVALGEWILLQACRDFLVLKKQGCDLKTVSINVSNIQFQRSDMISTLEKIIADTGIAPSEIELEITESYLASDENSVPEILQKIRKMGIKIAIDDFGTGYSSMSYLHKLPITRVKIDKAFVDGLPDNKGNLAISRAIIGLAKAFDLLVTAEGVETELQRQCLENEKCDEIQGYIYSKPLMLDELKSYIDSRESIAALA